MAVSIGRVILGIAFLHGLLLVPVTVSLAQPSYPGSLEKSRDNPSIPKEPGWGDPSYRGWELWSVPGLIATYYDLDLDSNLDFMVLDAAFLREEDRKAAVRVAQVCGCFPVLLQVSAPHDILRERIRQRIAYANDASEADLDVLQQQIKNTDPLSPEEKKQVIVCDNSGSPDISAIVSRIVTMADQGRN